MVNQTVDLVTLPQKNYCDRSSTPTFIPASELQAGQQILHQGARLKVRRVIPAFTRPQACHVHLVPPDWQPLEGVCQQLADRDEAAVLTRIACPTLKLFQIAA